MTKAMSAIGVPTVLCVAMMAGPASANTDAYCNGCQMYNQITSDLGNYLNRSYVHSLYYERYVGAGALNYANYVYGTGTIDHPYDGSHVLRPSARNGGSASPITVNAHGTF